MDSVVSLLPDQMIQAYRAIERAHSALIADFPAESWLGGNSWVVPSQLTLPPGRIDGPLYVRAAAIRGMAKQVLHDVPCCRDPRPVGAEKEFMATCVTVVRVRDLWRDAWNAVLAARWIHGRWETASKRIQEAQDAQDCATDAGIRPVTDHDASLAELARVGWGPLVVKAARS